MNIFRFKKWFFDVYTSTDEYFLLFLSAISVLGKTSLFLQANGAKKTVTGEYIQKLFYETTLELLANQDDSISIRQGSIVFTDRAISLIIDCTDFSVDLAYSSAYPVHYPMNSFSLQGPVGSGLSWNPIVLRGHVNGSASFGGAEKIQFRNDNGYADQVRSTFLPFCLPVHELFWGRLHSGKLDLTFTVINDSSGRKSQSKIYVIWKNRLIEFNTTNLVIHELKTDSARSLSYPEKYTITAENDGNRISLQIYSHAEAVSSDFIGDTTRYGKNTIRALKFISRNPKGIKSVARANVRISCSKDMNVYNNLTLIDEYVCFT